MKKWKGKINRRNGFRFVFAMLIFSSMLSFCAVARYVLTRNISFALTTSEDTLSEPVPGYIWSHSQDTMTKALTENYTLTFMADLNESSNVAIGNTGIVSVQIDTSQLKITTGFGESTDQIETTTVNIGRDAQDAEFPVEVSIVSDAAAKEIRTFIDNRLVQVYGWGQNSDTAKFQGTSIQSFAGTGVKSAYLYNKILTQAELSRNYFVDLLTYGGTNTDALPAFLQKSSVLRVYSASSSDAWIDQGQFGMSGEGVENIVSDETIYQGIAVATDSNATVAYTSSQAADLSNGYTVRYVLKMNGDGGTTSLFRDDSGNGFLTGGFMDRDFHYSAYGTARTVNCTESGRLSVAVTASQTAATVYVNNKPEVSSGIAEGGETAAQITGFTINPAGESTTAKLCGALYEVEVYNRVLSELELSYLYQRDVNRYQLENQTETAFMRLSLDDIPVYEGDIQEYNGEDFLTAPDIEGYEFSHWYCEEFSAEFMDDEFGLLLEAMASEGYEKVHIYPVYTAIPCQITLYQQDGTVFQQILTYYGIAFPKLPKGKNIEEDGKITGKFMGWGYGDGTPCDEEYVTEDLELYAIYEDKDENSLEAAGTESKSAAEPSDEISSTQVAEDTTADTVVNQTGQTESTGVPETTDDGSTHSGGEVNHTDMDITEANHTEAKPAETNHTEEKPTETNQAEEKLTEEQQTQPESQAEEPKLEEPKAGDSNSAPEISLEGNIANE